MSSRKGGSERLDCVTENQQRKLIRSYRLVFRRRWRIFRIQGWRIPLPGGLELRLLGYWLACLAAIFAPRPAAAVRPPRQRDARPRCDSWPCRSPPPGGSRAGRSTAARRIAPWSACSPGGCALGISPACARCPAPGTELAPLDSSYLGPDLTASALSARAASRPRPAAAALSGHGRDAAPLDRSR